MVYFLDLPKEEPKDAAEAKERIRELAKCCRDVMSDGVISEGELMALRQWISEAGWLRNFWPAGALGARILDVLEPSNDDKKARQELEKLLGEIAAGVTEDDCVTDYDEVGRVLYKDSSGDSNKFCFTGIFYFGTRNACWEAVSARGGESCEHVSGRLDYLVVGGVCSPRWITAGSGTKLNAARELRRSYEKLRKAAKTKPQRQAVPKAPKIISEKKWVELLPRLIEFRDGRAIGYAMFIPPAFRVALETFDFAQGDVVYDVATATDVWADTMRTLGLALQVTSAVPGPNGQIKFSIYRPDAQRSNLVLDASKSVSQEQFQMILKSGIPD